MARPILNRTPKAVPGRISGRLAGALIVLGLVAVGVTAGSSNAQEVTGKPQVINGGTLEIAGQRLRLAGISAPPADALCGPVGQEWRCGMEATMALALEVAQHWVSCTLLPQQSSEGITQARCKVGPYDLAGRVVLAGWAMAVEGYAFEEDRAQREGKGIWRGGYRPPPGWRGVKGSR